MSLDHRRLSLLVILRGLDFWGYNKDEALILNDAAVRTKLLDELQVRFPNLNNDMVIKAMGCTSNDRFLVWNKSKENTA